MYLLLVSFERTMEVLYLMKRYLNQGRYYYYYFPHSDGSRGQSFQDPKIISKALALSTIAMPVPLAVGPVYRRDSELLDTECIQVEVYCCGICDCSELPDREGWLIGKLE